MHTIIIFEIKISIGRMLPRKVGIFFRAAALSRRSFETLDLCGLVTSAFSPAARVHIEIICGQFRLFYLDLHRRKLGPVPIALVSYNVPQILYLFYTPLSFGRIRRFITIQSLAVMSVVVTILGPIM